MNMPLVLLNRRRRGGAAAFTPAGLFALAEPGVWYDPSDLTTLFQDTAGTTPVTTPGQTVALALDKSKGLVLGSELVTNGTFDANITGWTSGLNSPTLSWVATGVMRVTRTTAPPTFSVVSQTISGLVVGRRYNVTATFGNVASGVNPYVAVNSVATGTDRLSFVATATSHTLEVVSTTGAIGTSFDVDNISVKELPGFHATQATLASRPTYGIVPLGGRRNLLTRTEEFNDAAWATAGRLTVSANTSETTDPVGGNTAEKVTETVDNGTHRVFQAFSFQTSTNYTASVYWKKGTRRWVFLTIQSDSTPATQMVQWFDLDNTVVGSFSTGAGGTQASKVSASVTDVGNGWRRCSLTVSFGATVTNGSFTGLYTGLADTDGSNIYAGATNQTGYIWGAQLETGSSATAYQRVGSAFDVTEAGVASLSYLSFDGVDDFLITPTITPGIDRAQVFAGVRKLSDATQGVLVELGAPVATGGFTLQAPSVTPATNKYLYTQFGSAAASLPYVTGSQYSAPHSAVITGYGDIAADVNITRINAAQVANSATDQGTGNFANAAVYIGRRNGASLPFNGNIFSMIVRFGTNLDAGTITSTETWVNGKTGAYT